MLCTNETTVGDVFDTPIYFFPRPKIKLIFLLIHMGPMVYSGKLKKSHGLLKQNNPCTLLFGKRYSFKSILYKLYGENM